MPKQSSNILYGRVINITRIYLGPAADRFIDRQVRNHLQKDPDRLVKGDLVDLIDWVRVAMGYITEDDRLTDEYISRLKVLQ